MPVAAGVCDPARRTPRHELYEERCEDRTLETKASRAVMFAVGRAQGVAEDWLLELRRVVSAH